MSPRTSWTSKYPHGIPTVGGGIGGVSAARLTRVRSFTVAGLTLRGVPTDFSLDTKGGASQVDAGSIGSALLARFVVTFDYPHGRVFFAPGPDSLRPFDTRTSGLTLGLTGGQDSTSSCWRSARTRPRSSPASAPSTRSSSVDGTPPSQLGPGRRPPPALRRGGPRRPTCWSSRPPSASPAPSSVPLYDPLPDTASSSDPSAEVQ